MVKRSVFASLARVRSEHAVVTSERLGWGIETPESAQGGTFSTLMHSEIAQGLVSVHEACQRRGSRLVAAWPAYTAALACMRARAPASKARFVLILAHDFVAVATCGGGKRLFRAWVGPMSEKDWKAFSTVIGGFEARTSPSMADAILKRGAIAAISDGEPAKLCPIWGEIRGSGRLETVVEMEALAVGAARIPAGHPANMSEGFPRPRDLDRYLAGAASLGIAVAFTFGTVAFRQHTRLLQERAADSARVAGLDAQLAALARNEEEMSRLRAEIPERPGYYLTGRHAALAGLAALVPDAVTLTFLSIGRDDNFEIKAIVIGPGFDPAGFRASLEQIGFKPSNQEGWAYDPAAGTLSIRGTYGSPRS
jgi:hypothetical protein